MPSLHVWVALATAIFTAANAEQHIVRFTNNCGIGTPVLRVGGQTLSTDSEFRSDRPLIAAIVFLQTGHCGENGENCTLIETTLRNPTSPGIGSGTDISLIPPHSFSVPSGFEYFGSGCDGTGADCTDPNCPAAAHRPDDGILDRVCLGADVNLEITFCG